jgi:tetratricopeptide (TPR) repeat protein
VPEGGQRNTYFIDERTRRKDTPPPPRRQDRWVRADGARQEWEDTEPTTGRAGTRGRSKRNDTSTNSIDIDTGWAGSTGAALAALSGKGTLPGDVATEIRNAADVATAAHRERLVERAESAFGAFERGRFQDALRAIKPVADEAPAVADVRELAGLAAYRVGRWREAARHLKAFGELGDSTEHLPILMDCQRALHKPKKVAELWAELRQRSPEPDVLAEGRIVAAASLADGGDLNGAIAMLATAGASKALRNPSERHLRQWYLLADLYERAGDVPRAREYFERVLRAEPGAYDVADRLRGLGPERRPRTGSGRPSRAKSPKLTPKAAARRGTTVPTKAAPTKAPPKATARPA